MTDAISVASIKAQQEALQATFEQAQARVQEAQSMYVEKKIALITFNNKYGRVIAMMNED